MATTIGGDDSHDAEQKEEARKVYEQALTLDPRMPIAADNLACGLRSNVIRTSTLPSTCADRKGETSGRGGRQ
jgi:hypothetical protein